jgi:hypothetical protein
VDEQSQPRSTAIIAAVVVVLLVAPLTVVLLGVGVFVAVTDASAQTCTGGAGTTLAANGTTTGIQVGALNPAEMGAAAIIVAVGEQLQVPPQGIVVALAVASQESRFQNYANDGTDPLLRPEQRDVVQSLGYPHDAVGHDHGSVDAFQQQFPGWGTLPELMNPPTAATKFYEALLRVPGWAAMPLTVAAQTVQHSQFPGAYADDEPLARQLYTGLAGAGATAGNLLTSAPCTGGAPMSCPATGLPVEDGLTPDALRVVRCVQQTFGDHTYGGVGERSDSPTSDHPAGRAVDVMIAGSDTPTGKAHGTEIATWVTTHAAALGVTYVIWDAQIWTADNAAAGWAPYVHPSGGTSPTLEHRDHVHVSVHGDAGTNTAGGTVSAAGWTLPLDPGTYTLTSGYGPRVSPTGGSGTVHAGLDFAAPTGTPIRAAADGVVTFAGFNNGGFGNLVIIATAPNVLTYYAHQSALSVATGAQVSAGQVIGAVGTTGDSTGPHLHFEVRVAGATVDPLPYLRRQGLDPGSLGGRT